ncbi:MAG: pyrroline-5-carboxylate reductase [Myxococcota bacterium]|nr:pyrroline-5-carboxylate reductase [Myxococcota bacterium]
MTRGLEKLRLGFLGGGAMGEALAAGALAAGVPPEHVALADPDAARRAHLARAHGVTTHEDNAAVLDASDVVVLAVKPGLVPGVLAALAGRPSAGRPLWMSIAAGVPMARLEDALPAGARVVRAMPNTPALVGAGATAYVANAAATEADRAVAQELFGGVGLAWEAPAEDVLDAVTGVSGSGPAYVFVFLEALSDAGVRMGLPREAASALAVQTVLGAARLARETGRHPATLKDQVTSPGGTTIAALERLEAGGFRAAIHEAGAAATRRARELGSR